MITTKPSYALLFGIGLIASVGAGDGFTANIPRQGGAGDVGLTPLSIIADAFANSQSNLQVTQEGCITRILSDDTAGDRHQRIIVRLANDQTLLVTHNIDLAPRVPNPTIRKWNEEGGVIHWTHKDPDGLHVEGWLEYEGKRYCSLEWPSNVIFTDALVMGACDPGRVTANHNGIFPSVENTLFDVLGKKTARISFRRSPKVYFVKASNKRYRVLALSHK